MADDGRPLFAKRGDQCDHVSDRIEDAVCTDIGRRVGSAETPHIRRNSMETGGRERRDLMSPRIGQFRQPWQSTTSGPSPSSRRKISIPLAETVREDGIAFPPCSGDFV